MIYTGIGSRETPKPILDVMVEIGMWMGSHGHILRSGRAPGADSAFEDGCNRVGGTKEIYLPWSGFNGAPRAKGYILGDVLEAWEMAARFHPAWDKLTDGARKMMVRNSHQIMGLTMKVPTDLVICWTKEGRGHGGTGQALRIAKSMNIPIYDLAIYGELERLEAFLGV